MGIVVMPSYLDYWSDKFRYAKVGDIMSLKRYQQVRRYLHFVDNNMDDGDKYYKVRPVVEKIRQNCLKQQKKVTKFSIDEMMIAYKGSKAGKRKQYMKDKPNKWGFKNYVRAGISGIIYDFVLYGGDDTFRYHTFTEEELSLGFGAQVVIALCQSIDHKPAFVFCENFFSSPELFFILREHYGIFALGTIRGNRLRGAETILLTDKAMKKKPRGHIVQAVCNQNRLAIVRWNDNKAVTLISSFVASEPVEKIRRYCKDAKCKIDVQCPQIVRQYNKHMGGVDLADMLISLYKTPFKSRRWYLAIFSQMLDICVNNAWLLYRRKHSSNAKGKIPLKAFRYEIYETLLKANRCAKRSKTETAKVIQLLSYRTVSIIKGDLIPIKMPLTPSQVAQAVALIEQGLTQREVAVILNVLRSSMQYALKRYQETGRYFRRPGSGGVGCTSDRDDRFIILEILRNRNLTRISISVYIRRQYCLETRTSLSR
ncbi:hypothetical protein HF086_012260 [Spodoptera exigua]|uniref:PiggyBac transposable element-derived protein domain-containing protein n=1 Tax=Spodoptera exigua TaxID=7107 RepID=A0A922MF88_SPOEX|nr:hypothetical protein HF086_012260 [Spodoptera exigua]